MAQGEEVVTNGGVHTPRTPSLNGFSLTEYTANPTPPRNGKKADIISVVPAKFLLPNGYPDVRFLFSYFLLQRKLIVKVHAPHSNIPCIRSR
jgi:hypothetical protein